MKSLNPPGLLSGETLPPYPPSAPPDSSQSSGEADRTSRVSQAPVRQTSDRPPCESDKVTNWIGSISIILLALLCLSLLWLGFPLYKHHYKHPDLYIFITTTYLGLYCVVCTFSCSTWLAVSSLHSCLKRTRTIQWYRRMHYEARFLLTGLVGLSSGITLITTVLFLLPLTLCPAEGCAPVHFGYLRNSSP